MEDLLTMSRNMGSCQRVVNSSLAFVDVTEIFLHHSWHLNSIPVRSFLTQSVARSAMSHQLHCRRCAHLTLRVPATVEVLVSKFENVLFYVIDKFYVLGELIIH